MWFYFLISLQIYFAIERHPADFDVVMKRAREYGVEKFLLSGGNIRKRPILIILLIIAI